MSSKKSKDLSRRGFLKSGIGVTAAALIPKPAPAESSDPGNAPAAESADHSKPNPLRTTVNGRPIETRVGDEDSAAEFLRRDLGLTGCKIACGQGACGACTVHLDGRAANSCLLPATALHGREVTTVEGLGSELHAIQRAFMFHDGLQCGFCTPGFIMAATAFYETWRKDQGDRRPSRDAVASALSGNLCRCGAYEGIFKAVQDACSGRFDAPGSEAPAARVDAEEKVRGRAVYTSDVQQEGMLEGRTLRSPHAHAVLNGVDASAALAMDGVEGFIQMTPDGGRIRFVGQEIGALAAVSRLVADEALNKIRVDYELLPAAATVDRAMADGAVEVFERAPRRPNNASEGPMPPVPWNGNRRGPLSLFSVKKGLAEDRKSVV